MNYFYKNIRIMMKVKILHHIIKIYFKNYLNFIMNHYKELK